MTLRREITHLLENGWMSSRDLSVAVRIAEKDVTLHLQHIRRSIKSRGKKFLVEPWQCNQCGFVFSKRERLSKPGKCPQCKKGSFLSARFRVR